MAPRDPCLSVFVPHADPFPGLWAGLWPALNQQNAAEVARVCSNPSLQEAPIASSFLVLAKLSTTADSTLRPPLGEEAQAHHLERRGRNNPADSEN